MQETQGTAVCWRRPGCCQEQRTWRYQFVHGEFSGLGMKWRQSVAGDGLQGGTECWGLLIDMLELQGRLHTSPRRPSLLEESNILFPAGILGMQPGSYPTLLSRCKSWCPASCLELLQPVGLWDNRRAFLSIIQTS